MANGDSLGLNSIASYLDSHPFKHAMDASFIIKDLKMEKFSDYNFDHNSVLNGFFADSLVHVNARHGQSVSYEFLMNYFNLMEWEVEGLDEAQFFELFNRDRSSFELAEYFVDEFSEKFPGSKFYPLMSMALARLDWAYKPGKTKN